MPIDRIPILAEDYPLFDWDDYPLSYYGLGEGELVSGFQKETWNAIIDKILSALSAAGMSWDSKYTTASAAKITTAYGPLSATMFNSVRHNIDRPASVGWGWANNPNLCGYVGREDFKGYAEHGLSGDLFYAEYLLEMVRRLNLLLSIMKGTANLKEMDAPTLSLTESVHNLLSLPSAPMGFSEPAFSSFVCGLQAKKAGQFSFMDTAKTKHIVTVHDIPVKRMLGMEKAISLHKAKQASPFVANLKGYSQLIPSISQAAMEIFNCIYLSSAYGITETSTKTTLWMPQPYVLQAETKAESAVSAVPVQLEPQHLESAETSVSTAEATVTTPWSIHPQGGILSKAEHSTVFEKIRPRRLSGKTKAGASCIAILDSAWLSPIWVNGKLYIRQAYETNVTETALEVN